MVAQIDSHKDVIQQKLDRLKAAPPNSKSGLVSELNGDLENFRNEIKQLNNKLQRAPQSDRQFYAEDVQNFQNAEQRFTDEVKREAVIGETERRNQEQLQTNAQKSAEAVDNLDEAIRLGNKTNNTLAATQATLADDRKRLEHIDQNVDKIDQEAEKGNSTAKDMLKRQCFNGCIMWTIVVLLGLIFIISIIVKAATKKKK